MRSYFDALDVKYVASLFVNRVDVRGAIKKHPSALQEAFRLGKQLVSVETPLDKSVDVELI
jgi:hypothetical protein